MKRQQWSVKQVRNRLLLVIISVMVCGSVSAADGAEQGDSEFAKQLQHVLQGGLNKKADLKMVARQIESLESRFPEEPRLRYAYGLILQNHLREKEAAIHFQSAIQIDPSCGPAWRSLIKIRLAEKAADNLCDELVALSEALGNSKLDWQPTEPHELATWLGRVHGFLSLDEVEIVSPTALEHNVTIVHRRLPTLLHTDYEAGRQRLTADYDARLIDVELAIANDESKTAQRTTDELKEL